MGTQIKELAGHSASFIIIDDPDGYVVPSDEARLLTSRAPLSSMLGACVQSCTFNMGPERTALTITKSPDAGKSTSAPKLKPRKAKRLHKGLRP